MTEARSPEKQQAIIDNVELARKVAWTFCAHRALTRLFEEFKHQAMLALVIAVDDWDDSRCSAGAKISGPYLVQRIKWQLIRYAHEQSGMVKSHYDAVNRGEEPPVVMVPLVLSANDRRESENQQARQLTDYGATRQVIDYAAARQISDLHVRLSLESLFRIARLSDAERTVLFDAMNEVPREQTARRIGRGVNHVRQDAMTRLKEAARTPPSS